LATHAERAKDLERRETELTTAKAAHRSEQQTAAARLEDLNQQESSLKLKEQALAAREQQIKRQRQSVSKQLRARKNELAAEAEQIRAQAAAAGAGQDLELQLRLSELQGKYQHLRDEVDSRVAQRDEATERLADLKAQLEARQQRQTELEAERKELQASLKQQREESQGQTEAAKAELARHAGELDRVRRESQEQIERLRADFAKSSENQVQAIQQQLDVLQVKLTESEAASARIQREFQLQLEAAQKSGRGPADEAKLTALRDENKQLEAWLAEAEEKAKNSGSGGGQETDDLRRRFEMAVQDVRELKTKNAELTEQLAKRSSTVAASAGAATGGDWESLKKKLLADLETDFDAGDPEQSADKMTVQGAIKITDEVVAQKEQEVTELRRLLESQTQQVGEMAVGAAAVAQMLDTDELIRQEREALKRLQDSLREQLRQAEVDISVERAKLARERSELDEKLRGLEAEKANMPAAGGDAAGAKGKKPGGRKWLTRLGLGDGKEE
jgi:hypothetical protein